MNEMVLSSISILLVYYLPRSSIYYSQGFHSVGIGVTNLTINTGNLVYLHFVAQSLRDLYCLCLEQINIDKGDKF